VATTVTSAASARRRRSSSQSGKYEPCRSFGIASSILPARVSHSRRRYPLQIFTRSSLRTPNGAPQTASASAPISAPANVFTISRSRSGLAAASCSCSQPDRSILGLAAIAFSSSRALSQELNEDHAVAVSHHDATLTSGTSNTTPADATVQRKRARWLPTADAPIGGSCAVRAQHSVTFRNNAGTL